MIEKIDVERYRYTSEQKREKMLLDKVNELVDKQGEENE